VTLKSVHIVSIMGNKGTLEKQLIKIITDFQLLYHCIYIAFCFCGLIFHPFFYSLLVRWINSIQKEMSITYAFAAF